MSTTSKLGADMTDFQINLLASHYWEIKEVMGVRTDKFDAVGFARALLDRQPAPSVEQDERGALIRAFDASLSGVPRYVIDRFGVEHVADGGGWIKESDLFDRFAASTSANVAQLDMSLEARLADAEADVKRLHAEKMELWNQVHGYSANVAQGAEAKLEFMPVDSMQHAIVYGSTEAIGALKTRMERDYRIASLVPAAPAQTAITVTPAMVKAAIPWLTGLHHMRNTDAKAHIKEAIKAALAAAQSASGDTE